MFNYMPWINRGIRRLKDAVKRRPNHHVSRVFLLARSAKRRKTEGTTSFRSLEDLHLGSQDLANKIPNNYDLIVGVPRSGLLPANCLALKFGRPLLAAGSPDAVAPWISGSAERPWADPKRILVVDDSSKTGSSLKKTRDDCARKYPSALVHTAAVFITPEVSSMVEYSHEVVPWPRFFEWNLMHSKQGKLATDMDGVLCENCPPGISKDERQYIAWMNQAKPHLIPAFRVDFIVTNRLDRYRSYTEAWLEKNGVLYDQLLMLGLEQKPEIDGYQIEHKVGRLCDIKPDIFWESSEWEAENIWRRTRIPTLCTDEMIFYP